jgi:hypothetical protein
LLDILINNGYNEDGTIRILEHRLQRTTHIVPTNRYLGRRIQAIDLSQIRDDVERMRIENKRAVAWQEQAVAARPYDNNNPVPLGRNLVVPMGGRKSRRGRKSKKSRKTRRSIKRRARKTNRRTRR